MLQKEYLTESIKISKNVSDLSSTVIEIKNYLNKYFRNNKISYKPHSIIESRFIPTEVAFFIGMQSCGSITNIVTDMLRHLGYEVKKVHGSIPQSADHSWIKVRNQETDIWESYDMTQRDCKVSASHTEIAECDEWIDIADEIVKSHLHTTNERSKNHF
jgi:hypothetical protein